MLSGVRVHLLELAHLSRVMMWHHVVLAHAAHHLWRRARMRVVLASSVGVALVLVQIRLIELVVGELSRIAVLWQWIQVRVGSTIIYSWTKLKITVVGIRMLIVRAVHLHLLRHQKVLLLLSLMVMIINILSSIQRVGLRGLSHHVRTTIVNLTSVELVIQQWLVLLLEQHQVLVYLSWQIWRLVGGLVCSGRAHTVHIVHWRIVLADVVERADVHNHVLVKTIDV